VLARSLFKTAVVGFLAIPCPAVLLAQSVETLVGDYNTGVGLSGDVLQLKADGTFTFTHLTDVGDSSTAGRFQLDGSLLRLQAEVDSDQSFLRTPQELLVVPWGRRTYLLRTTQRIDFCNWINMGLEPRQSEWMSLFLLREGDYRTVVTGPPELPSDWRSCILKAPLRAKVIAVKNRTVTISAGGQSGVFMGMELEALDAKGLYLCSVTVTELGPETSQASATADCGPMAVGYLVRSQSDP
jgi:hypothetical protein